MNIYDDPRTIPRDQLREKLSAYWLGQMGHAFNGHDGLVYRVVGWRDGDGPWIEEVLGRARTRTISGGAIGATFHHHRMCPVCNEHPLRLAEVDYPYHVEWDGCDQVTDGTTIWINSSDGMCIGRLSPRGIDVHASAERQLEGEHCLHCETAAKPCAKEIAFAMYVQFCAKMKEHHGVEVSRALPVAIQAEEQLR